MSDAPKTAGIISKFFFEGEGLSAQDKMKQLKALTPEDKLELAAGITNGTLTY